MNDSMMQSMKRGLAGIALAMASGGAWAADFHVTTAQELQNALTTAAVNGAPDTIWFAAGYYTGNFNFSSAEAADLTLRPEPGVDATQVTIDGAGTGRSLNIASTAAANITVTNLTFLRNCGGTANAALLISTMSSASGADVSVSGCRFLGSTNHQGKGIEIVSARNATVRNCTVSRTGTAEGDGLTASGITGELHLEGNNVSGTGASYSGRGISAAVSAQGFIWITGNTVCNNNIYSDYGAGIYSSGTATISANNVTGNSADFRSYGGGIFAVGSGVVISGNTLTGNQAYYDGGGIYASIPGGRISGNTVTGNSGSQGGGIFASGSGVTVTGNTVTGNSGGQGGGIHGYGIATISSNTVTGNTGGNGGGIFANYVETISGNTVAGNTGSQGGGGIYCGNASSTLLISGNLVLRNRVTATSSGIGGGGIYVSMSPQTLKLFNNVIGNNTTPSGTTGGGLWLNPGTRLEMINNTVTGNSGGNGGGAAISISGVTEQLYAYNNIIWGNSATGNGKDVWLAGTGQRKEFLHNNAHDLYGVWDIAENNIDAAPLFYDPLHDDYHLRFGSPGIDAGTNAVAMLPATDIDGDARLINSYPDLGADEFNNLDYHPADLNSDWTISDAEYNAYAAAWKNDQTWTPGPVPVPADYVTRAGYLKVQNSGAYHNAGGPKPVCWKTGAP